ncbi:testis-specific serine/threonine-protein kinase 2-like [Oppia nitens]|uniref:testis-specific serine/threonine-protein kinase 2-like n=1 Tax=Oppia nitens TaxID=1686743 RepID=UPI0023D9A9D7|nr:testis-specific serine/threonine-protein kinase 2-like [Oppia nitens]
MCFKDLLHLLCPCFVSLDKKLETKKKKTKKEKKVKNKHNIKDIMRQTIPSDKTKDGWLTSSGEEIAISKIDSKDLTRVFEIPDDFESVDECIRHQGWELMADIGKGSNSKVMYGIKINTQQPIACKILEINDYYNTNNKDRQNIWESFKRELVLLVREKHRNIIQVFDHFIVEEKVKNKFCCYIVMELSKQGSVKYQMLDENTDDYNMKKYRKLSETKTKLYFRDTANGLQYLHNKQIAHKDLKLGNLLVFIDNNGQEMVKIADFGTSRVSYKEDVVKEYKCFGTVEYMSPQIFKIYVYINTDQKIDNLKKYNPFQADLWSLGVCLYVMICAKIPFLPNNCETYKDLNLNLDTYKSIYQNMIIKNYDISNNTRHTYTEHCFDILSKLLHPNTRDRITIDGVLQHNWLNS